MFKEIEANIWDFTSDVKVITTNGNIKKNGNAVMGKGIAAQASYRYPLLSGKLGLQVKVLGNICFFFHEYKIITFPTKHNWWDKADYNLIKKSMEELYEICQLNNIKRVIMTRVGCSNGGLDWTSVKNVIKDILDTNNVEFVVVHND